VAVAVLAAAVLREAGEMKTSAQHFLTEEQQDKVTKTVQQAELTTSGEIVPMIVSACHDYAKARFLTSLLFSLPAALIIPHFLSTYLWLEPDNVYLFLCLMVPLFLVFNQVIIFYPRLAKLFLSNEEMEGEVQEEAVKCFFEEKLYATRDANGILVFISVFEKKAWILADHGIDRKIDPQIWVTLVNELTAKIKDGERCTALCQTISEIGQILQQHFPYKKDDTDELHNLIIK